MMEYYSEEICPGCNSHLVFTETPETVHYGRLDCLQCRKWIKWVRNPESPKIGTTQVLRGNKHSVKDVCIFHKFETEHCFICQRTLKQLGSHEVLTVDHIEELDKGGKDIIENKQVLCSACHKMKNWLRLYLYWHLNKEDDKNGEKKAI